MNVGVASADITPSVGSELSGFAARVQPSTGMLDPLRVRALWLEEGGLRLLWLHCDLIGFSEEIVAEVRTWAKNEFELMESEVLLSATHTHAGPATIHLEGAGEYDRCYIGYLHEALKLAARLAISSPEPCTLLTTESRFDLAVHRTGPGTRHVDNRIQIVGFRRGDGSFAAIVANYAIHPVALGYENREISGDLHGWAASQAAFRIKGKPEVFLTNGACGNLNPPASNVPWTQVQAWGTGLASVIVEALSRAVSCSRQDFDVARAQCVLPLDPLNEEQLDSFVTRTRANLPSSAFGEKLGSAVLRWREVQQDAIRKGTSALTRTAEIHAVRFGDIVLVGLNAEIFSMFNDWLRQKCGMEKIAVVGYANGDMGYICPHTAYADGGYEVDMAHVFYGGWRLAPGALEMLASEAAALVRSHLLQERDPNPQASRSLPHASRPL